MLYGGFRNGEDVVGSLPMSLSALETAFLGPASVSVHDDRDVIQGVFSCHFGGILA